MTRRTTMRGNQAAWGTCLSGLAVAALLASQAPVVRAPVIATDAVELHEADPRFRAAHPRQALAEARALGILSMGADAGARSLDVRRAAVAIVRESARNGLDPTLLAAVVKVESRFRPRAMSHKGARGMLQLMPKTARELARRGDGLPGYVPSTLRTRQLHDVELNVALGARYLGVLVRKLGSEDAALAAYNKGPAAAKREFGRRDDWHRAKYVKAVRSQHATIAVDVLALN